MYKEYCRRVIVWIHSEKHRYIIRKHENIGTMTCDIRSYNNNIKSNWFCGISLALNMIQLFVHDSM